MANLLEGIGAAVAALIVLAATASADTAARCEAGKLKTAGKHALCRLKADAVAVRTGRAPDYSRCDSKLLSKWATTEAAAGGMCPTNGDAGALQTRLARHATEIASCLAGSCPPTCGDAVIESGEQCDQGNLGSKTCVSEGFVGGTLACGPGCTLNTAGCWDARFVDNGDGTISDEVTGLMWEKKYKEGNPSDPSDPT